MDPIQLLQWYKEMGVDEAVDDAPRNLLAARRAPAAKALPPPPMREETKPGLPPVPSDAIAEARRLADACSTRNELEEAVRNFNGCSLKKTAMKTVFSDGNPTARVMLIGEAPGAQEDMQGIPFCGPSGKLLDKVLASIGLSRESVYISNTVFWRPPGNRAPSAEETAICEPFVQKHIALINPALLLLAGGVASTAVLKRPDSVGRLRGKVHEYATPYLNTPVPAIVIFHPSYLLRSPGQKKLAWQDMLRIHDFLKDHAALPPA